MNNQALLKAFLVCGSQSELARRIGATTPQVNEWAKGHRPIPLARCPQIEEATEGQVKCEDLRPDAEWLRDADNRAFYREAA